MAEKKTEKKTENTEKTERTYSIVVERDGELFERTVGIKGIPFWRPQKEGSGHNTAIVGCVEDFVVIPATEAVERETRGMVLRTAESYWIVNLGAALERQVEELGLEERLRKDGEVVRVLIEYEGKAKTAKPGRQPANRFNLSVCRGAVKTAAGGSEKTEAAVR